MYKTNRSIGRFTVLAITLSALILGCGGTRNQLMDVPAVNLPAAQREPERYLIQPTDELDIRFFYNPELNETVQVRPDGKISLQLVDDVQAAGLTPSELDEALTQRYADELKKPEVTVIVRTFSSRQVYVGGEVTRPGAVDLMVGMTPLQAVIGAGGFNAAARPDAAILIRRGPDNKPIPMRLNLDQVASEGGVGTAVQLQPHDIVYVPKTWIAKANLFVNQYIEQLLMFRGFAFGFGYDLNNND